MNHDLLNIKLRRKFYKYRIWKFQEYKYNELHILTKSFAGFHWRYQILIMDKIFQ